MHHDHPFHDFHISVISEIPSENAKLWYVMTNSRCLINWSFFRLLSQFLIQSHSLPPVKSSTNTTVSH